MAAVRGAVERPHGHDRPVDRAGDDRERDQARVLARVARRDDQEQTEGAVHTDHHQLVVGLVGDPLPAGGPELHQREQPDEEDQPEEQEREAQIAGTGRIVHESLRSDGDGWKRGGM